jgi:hypothetical protein
MNYQGLVTKLWVFFLRVNPDPFQRCVDRNLTVGWRLILACAEDDDSQCQKHYHYSCFHVQLSFRKAGYVTHYSVTPT